MAPKLLLSNKLLPEQLQSEPDITSLRNKRVLVTGGASGLGAAFVQAYAEAGAFVTIVDKNAALASSHAQALTKKELRVQAVQVDVSGWSSQVSAFQTALRFGTGEPRIDHVIVSAGVDTTPFFPPTETTTPSADNAPEEPPTAVLDINAKGVIYTTRLAQYYMGIPSSEVHDKLIVLMASSGAYWPIPLNGRYCASKGAVRSLFRTMRGPLASRGIRMNMLAPWLIRTPLTAHLVDLFGKLGYPVCEPEVVTRATLLLATNTSVIGRALQAGLGGVTDLRDDAEGHHAGLEINELVEKHLGGFDNLDAINEKILNSFGYLDITETN